jgi:copper(I)-binding protein
MNMRLFVVVGFILALLAAFAYTVSNRDPGIIVTSATAKLSNKPKLSASVFFNVENMGMPDVLVSVTSAYASNAIIVRPEQFNTTAIPGGSSAVFSSDGVYLELSGIEDDLKPGDLVPVTLLFQEAGKVSFKVIISESSIDGMDHTGHHKGVSNADHPVPQVSLSVTRKQDESGWQIDVSTQEFAFYKPQGPVPHSPGQGHAHIYLNGLKLQRLYGNSASIGNLPPGTYTVNVTLNTNMHNVYRANGKAVSAKAIITSD